MHSNQQTAAGLFPSVPHVPPPELEQAIRDNFRALAERLAELLPTNPNATFAFRALRQAQDAALLAATDVRSSSAPLPPTSATSSSTPPATSSSTPATSSSTPATSSSTPPATPATHVILGPDGAPITPRPGQKR